MAKTGWNRAVGRGAGLLVALGLATAIGGCNAEFCDIQDCTGDGGGGPGGGGTGGGSPVQCDLVDGQPIAESCGVFVKAGATGGNGSQSKPFGALEDAVSKLGGKGGAIYACAGSFAGSITVPAGISIVGGVDCANGFLYDSTKSTALTGDEDTPAIVFSGGMGAGALRGFAITAPPATDDGGSSIGVIVNDMPFTFEYVTIATGDAKAGAQQTLPPKTDGSNGANGGCFADAPMANAACGGAGGGGRGATEAVSAQGGDPGGAMSGGSAGGTDCVPVAGAGSDSTVAGDPGLGQSTFGDLSLTGFSNPPAAENDGQPGQAGGGGGGGGVKSAACAGATQHFGSDGGNGGCAGRAGKAGNPGGSSIAIVVLGGSAPSFVDVTLVVGAGGNGGEGQPGGAGGAGGDGGVASAGGCAGGKGGAGSAGGKGGGGAGGHSVGVAHQGLTLGLAGIAMVQLAGGGSSGAGVGASGAGAAGLGCRALSLPDGACEP